MKFIFALLLIMSSLNMAFADAKDVPVKRNSVISTTIKARNFECVCMVSSFSFRKNYLKKFSWVTSQPPCSIIWYWKAPSTSLHFWRVFSANNIDSFICECIDNSHIHKNGNRRHFFVNTIRYLCLIVKLCTATGYGHYYLFQRQPVSREYKQELWYD